MWSSVSKSFANIRFWIALFFVIRLVGITNPPLEVAHNWRQTAVNTVARNFAEIDSDIFYPRFDTAGDHDGVSGTEFPLFNYLIFLWNELFGYAHWYGRLINLLVSSMGVFFFYRIIERWFNSRHAFYSSLVLLASLWFTFSRKIMPDTFSLSLVLIGLFYGLAYLKKGGGSRLLWYVLFTSIGLLSKIPSAVLPIVLILPLLDHHIETQRKFLICSMSLIPIGLAGWWYFYWFDHITTDYQLFRMGPGVSTGFKQLIAAPLDFLDNFYFDALKFSGFAIFCWGFLQAILKRNRRALSVFLVTGIAFSGFMLQAGYGFSMHEYYTLPFIPVMAFIAGYGLSVVRSMKWRNLLLVIIIIEGIANQQHDFFIKESQRYKLSLETFIQHHVHESELVVVNGGHNPQMMYFAHRRGWTLPADELDNQGLLQDLTQRGAHFLIWDKHVNHALPVAIPAIAENEHFAIFDLQPSYRKELSD